LLLGVVRDEWEFPPGKRPVEELAGGEAGEEEGCSEFPDGLRAGREASGVRRGDVP